MRTKITIPGLFLLVVAAALLSIQQQSSLAFAAREEYKNVLYVGREDRTTDIIELVSGILAAILFVLSLRAYRKLKRSPGDALCFGRLWNICSKDHSN